MLARAVPGALVVVGASRFASGRHAESALGATVHLLDDGFQHLQLDRDVDVVLVAAADVAGASTFPSGRLREPADVLVAADAIVAIDHLSLPGVRLADADVPIFSATRTVQEAVFDPPVSLPSRNVLAVAGIAVPQPFLDSIEAAGWTVVATKLFADHHAYSSRDVAGLISAARGAAAAAVLTTEKDYVRLLPFRPFALPVGRVPLTMEPEPRAEFRQWLVSSIASARDIVLV
jgi:tetraacyldisaccharide 4'-kinase